MVSLGLIYSATFVLAKGYIKDSFGIYSGYIRDFFGSVTIALAMRLMCCLSTDETCHVYSYCWRTILGILQAQQPNGSPRRLLLHVVLSATVAKPVWSISLRI
jgi:hypothetical protein